MTLTKEMAETKLHLMFSVDSILERMPHGEIGLTIRVAKDRKTRYGVPPMVGYIKESVHLRETNPDNYVVEYKDGSRRCITGKPAKSLRDGWTFARYMPRDCARMFYRLKRVTLKPLLDVTDEDAVVAGSKDRAEYLELWDRLNAARGHPSKGNPMCWFVRFEIVEVRK